MIPSSPYYYMFSFLSPSKKRMFVLVRLLFRPDFEKRQALQQHTHTFFFRDGCSKRQKKLFLTTKILRLRALPRGLFVQKKRIIHESSSSSQKKRTNWSSNTKTIIFSTLYPHDTHLPTNKPLCWTTQSVFETFFKRTRETREGAALIIR